MRIYTTLEGLCIAVLVMLHSSLSKGIHKEINCTYPELKYSIINKTSGSDEVLRCSKCRECGLGMEPEVPCGTTLGIHERHGKCKKCEDGMYSDADDTNTCKMCRYRLCFEHQLYEGNCTKKKDDSHCLPKCEAGYVMNQEQTKCEVDLQVYWSEPQNHTNMLKSTLSTMTKPADLDNQKEKKNEAQVAIIVGVVFGILFIVVVIIITVCYRSNILGPNPEVTDGTEDSDLHLSKNNEPLEDVNYPKQEESFKELDSASNSSVEPTTPPEPNVANRGSNNGYYSHTPPPPKGPLGFDQHVRPPTHEEQNRLPEPLFSPTHAVRFERLSFATYHKICQTFDAGTVGMSWRDLAGWLGFKRADVILIELTTNKTDHVIRRWEGEAENTVIRFVEILEENKMTCLSHEIRAELNL